MKINQVEQLVGITKKNIRFYEEQGLLCPGRNRENGYREYCEDDIRVLQQIKLLRKLGLPLEEIRLMQCGKSTVADSMRRHLVTIEREQLNLVQAAEFCQMLRSQDGLLEELDAAELLQQMERLEKEGTSFRDVKGKDVKRARYAGALISSVAMIVFMIGCFALILWAFETDPEGAPPFALMIVVLALPAVVIGGVVLALVQRIGEIRKGEADDARQF